MSKHHTLPKEVEARLDEKLKSMGFEFLSPHTPPKVADHYSKMAIKYVKEHLRYFLAQEIAKAEERGGRKAVEKCNICISEEAYKKILKLIDNPPEPTQNLINAMKRYRKLTNPPVKENHDTTR